MIEDIGSAPDNLIDFKEISLNQDVNIDDAEQEDKLNTIKNKWKKRLDRAKHKNTDEAPVKLQDFSVEEGEDDQNLLTIEMEGKQDVKVTFHRLFRKKEE